MPHCWPTIRPNPAATPAGDFSNICGSPTILTADLAKGKLSSFAGVTSGFPYGMAVDSATSTPVVPTICDNLLGIYDLLAAAMASLTLLRLGGGYGLGNLA
jgi:hypothetical protein